MRYKTLQTIQAPFFSIFYCTMEEPPKRMSTIEKAAAELANLALNTSSLPGEGKTFISIELIQTEAST